MSSSEFPLVSIVIPVYNGSNYLGEAIDSALSQTYPNIEIIVVNDGSTDGGATDEVAFSYKDKIRYFHKENGGVSTALNYGIRQMKGEYFAWLSHDDKHLPKKVEKQMDAIIKHGGEKPVICVCNYILIDGFGNEIARSYQDIEKYFRISPKCFLGSEPGFMIDGDATLISRKLFDICGFFDEVLFASQETDMWFRSLDKADFLFLPDYLVEYRSHSGQVTHKRAAAVGKEAGKYRGKIVELVSIPEMQKYYSTEMDAIRFGVAAHGYLCALFYEATHQMISKLRQLCLVDWEFTRSALKGMLEHTDVDCIINVMKTHALKETKKTKVLFYCSEEIQNSLMDRLKALANGLQADYEFYWAYCGEVNYDLPENVVPIRLSQSAKPYLASYLALLVELLDVNIYWCNTTYFVGSPMTLNYLAESSIRRIVSFNYFEHSTNGFNSNLCGTDWQTSLANASIVTHEQNEMMFTPYMYPNDAILMPYFCGEAESCNKWDKLFKSVLAPKFNLEQLENDFSVVKNEKKDSVAPLEGIQKLQEYLEKYEQSTLNKHRLYYEHSLYWRITKPLRVVADFLRGL